VLLLQLGMGNTMIVVHPASQPANLAATIVHDDCAGDECSMDGCTPQQECGTSGGAACDCYCAQILPLAGAVVAIVATLPEVVAFGDMPGTVTRRLDTPFRPPA